MPANAAGREAAGSEAPPPLPKTLEEVGRIIGVTKERVRQIQNRALTKLRNALEERILAASAAGGAGRGARDCAPASPGRGFR